MDDLFWLWPAGGALLGAVIGSFLAALVVRWPQGKSVMAGRSGCDSCGHVLTVKELVPIVSHIAQRGRCRQCGAPIGHEHLIVETACALVGSVALAISPNLAGLAGALCAWILVALAALDVRHLWLPDRLTVSFAILAAGSALFDPVPDLTDRLLGGGAGFISLWLIALAYRTLRGKEGLGQGDAKLLGGIGLWLGWQMLPLVLLLAAGTGLVSVLTRRLRGDVLDSDLRLPLGALMAIAAFPLWIISRGAGVSTIASFASLG